MTDWSDVVPHQYDPNMQPDSDFVAGDLRFLVPGNKARLLDPRRTPLQVDCINEAAGLILFRVEAFEDEGFIRTRVHAASLPSRTGYTAEGAPHHAIRKLLGEGLRLLQVSLGGAFAGEAVPSSSWGH